MTLDASNLSEYISKVPDYQQELFSELLDLIRVNLPSGYQECINYNMPSWVVPHATYAAGYHCDPTLPLPFLSIAAQKNTVNFYHMGLYAIPELHEWFVSEFAKTGIKKLDMGKSCIRFKKIEDIPMTLIAELVKKINPEQWIAYYESLLKPVKKG